MKKSTRITGNVLVTGGAGFIGSHIVEELLDHECSVTVLDDLSTGTLANLESFREKITFVEGSIADLELMNKVCAGMDYVIHEAAIPSVPKSIDDPARTHMVNVTGTFNVFLASRDNNVKRVVYACSSSTYGNDALLPAKETSALNPLSPYAVHKAINEYYGKIFYEIYGLETVGLKYFNVFGPRQNPHSKYSAVIPKFIHEMLRGNSPILFGDGTTTRDFTYVKNVAQANVRALTAPHAPGHIINVSSGGFVSLSTLVEEINYILGTTIAPTYEGFRKGDILHSHADISKAEELLGYKVLYSFADGLRETIEHLRKNL